MNLSSRELIVHSALSRTEGGTDRPPRVSMTTFFTLGKVPLESLSVYHPVGTEQDQSKD